MSSKSSDGSLLTGDDGALRCWWCATSEVYSAYHDAEWGRPVVSDDGLFERLSLEAFQSGLSWLTILRKRDHFRDAFANFHIARVASFGPRDIERLLTNPGIVRNRRKVEAAVANARAAASFGNHGAFAGFVWSFAPRNHPARRKRSDIPSSTPESTRLAIELKRRGFRFVGPTTIYALMQACGLVNDHIVGCFVRPKVAKDRSQALLELGPKSSQ